jgi:hypothetical protein
MLAADRRKSDALVSVAQIEIGVWGCTWASRGTEDVRCVVVGGVRMLVSLEMDEPYQIEASDPTLLVIS